MQISNVLYTTKRSNKINKIKYMISNTSELLQDSKDVQQNGPNNGHRFVCLVAHQVHFTVIHHTVNELEQQGISYSTNSRPCTKHALTSAKAPAKTLHYLYEELKTKN